MSPANISISICCLFIAFAIVAIVIIAAAEAAASPKQMKKKRNHKNPTEHSTPAEKKYAEK